MALRMTVFLIALFCIWHQCHGALKMVVGFNRHGARGPLYESTNISHWEQRGQLTAIGMRQLYLLGRKFREIYQNTEVLPSEYDVSKMYIRAVPMNRTIMSAMSMMYGIFEGKGPSLKPGQEARAKPPFDGIQDVSMGLSALPNNYQPVSIIVSSPEKEDILLAYDDHVCPGLAQMKKDSWESKDAKRIAEVFKVYIEAVSKNFSIPKEKQVIPYLIGIPENSILDVMEGYPSQLPKELWDDGMAYFNVTVLYLMYATPLQASVVATKLFGEIFDKIDGLIAGKSNIRWAQYSGQDLQINLILVMLNLTSWECQLKRYIDKNTAFDEKCLPVADLAASLRFEVHQENEKYQLKLFYNERHVPIFGEKLIDYTTFKAKMDAKLVTKDFDKYCLGDPKKVQPKSDRLVLGIVIGFAVFCLLLLGCVIRSCLAYREIALKSQEYSSIRD
jgi:hypothetical protein